MTINPQMIETIRAAFGNLDRMDPSGPTYKKLCALLDRADDDALKAVHDAKIKFVSMLAHNRIVHRKMRRA